MPLNKATFLSNLQSVRWCIYVSCFLCRSSEDLVHRLFVCIAGVADQLQTNFAGDLRHILKCVFLMNASSSISTEDQDSEEGPVMVEQEPPSSPSGDNGK
jgi:hypothetical protein